ncbi:spermidine/putrescine-binding protein [Ereboglobus sp. PH5-5]|uniref:ABC transporter substrate-binding protein n=1 Tax=unclassified Ereboglobus TaxID=2626932 RepID=UPI0024049221|nr:MULTISPECIES: spermidine/putrescine ABC transporter substrate-binding protein [unclassified Ereboglobus]MDF9826687.1 spermidine/putrescine-binding protein [Ereboglobus sp. PH5-10]MDF9833425.1 spermidine/putrescine-binding protein [Ereboglobus sp. PH5-5]
MKKPILIAMLSALVALAAGLASCSRTTEPNKQINLFAWSEYIPQSVIDEFTKETGIKVNYETFATGEEMLNKVLAGGTKYDIIQPCDYIAEGMIRNNLLLPLDYTKLPNFENIMPEFKRLAYDPGQKFTVPFMVGGVGIVVNTEKVKEQIRGYKDIFQPKYAGRIVVLDDGRELVTCAFETLGIPINNITKENLERARPVIAEWMKYIKIYDSDSPKNSLSNGDVDIGVVWNGEAARLWFENKKFQYVRPAEGAHFYVDVFAIPHNARNTEAAHKFIDYIMRPEVSREISRVFPYTNPNGAARKLLTQEELDNVASYPNMANIQLFRDIPGSGELTDQLYTDLKNAAGR